MPALIESEHPRCAHLIREYLHCSRTASLLSKVFSGECTSVKYQLDACFRDEKVERTKRNIVKAQARHTPLPVPYEILLSSLCVCRL